ncbi:MAG: ethanolamine utilization protein EutH, partial [Oscillospiraceae bacterium]
MWVMAIGAIIGGIDRILGNKLGLGEKFEEG